MTELFPPRPTVSADHPARQPHLFRPAPNADMPEICAVCATVREIGPHTLGAPIVTFEERNNSGGYSLTAELTGADGARYRAIIRPDDGWGIDDLRGESSAEIVTWQHSTGSRHGIGDRGPTLAELAALEYGGWSGLVKHLTRNGALVVLPVSGISHSGESIWVASAPAETSPMDAAGWDSGQWGFVTVTRDKWRDDYKVCTAEHPDYPNGHPNLVLGNGTCKYGRTAESDARADADAAELIPFEGKVRTAYGATRNAEPMARAESVARYAVQELDDLMTGNVYGYTVERLETWQRVKRGAHGGRILETREGPEGSAMTVTYPTAADEREEWEAVDSCGGYIGDVAYCEAEARSALLLAAGYAIPQVSAEWNRSPLTAHVFAPNPEHPNYCATCARPTGGGEYGFRIHVLVAPSECGAQLSWPGVCQFAPGHSGAHGQDLGELTLPIEAPSAPESEG